MVLRRVRRFLRPDAGALLLLLPGAMGAQPPRAKPSEYEVKAVYLYNFAKFVEWPSDVAPSDEDGFTICILGRDPFGDILARTLKGELLHGRRATTRRIDDVNDAPSCRILFIAGSEHRRLGTILDSLKNRSVLTVSDMMDFSERGGMIQLVLDEDRVRFEINLTAATRAGLTLSSELLKVARNVRRESSGVRPNPVLLVLPELARASETR